VTAFVTHSTPGRRDDYRTEHQFRTENRRCGKSPPGPPAGNGATREGEWNILMRRHSKLVVLASVTAATALVVTACSSSKSKGTSASNTSSGKTVAAAYSAANTGLVNASTHTGGVVKYAESSTPDSMDPGNTYYAYMWDFSRLYASALTTFAPVPGAGSLQLVPNLATSLGVPSDGGKTWTYHLRPNLKYSDGTAITSADVKYAVERSNYSPAVLSNGPTYFNAQLVNNTPKYAGPYVDKTGDLHSIETPDATTIVFHLKAPFADFDYLTSNPQTAPVPKAKDTGATYVKNIISSGPYMFKSYTDGKGAVLVKNPNWSESSGLVGKQYADELDITFNQEQTSIDQDLIAGNLQQDLSGAGAAASTQPLILNDASKKANADDALSGALAYVAINTQIKPLDNVDCRKAVEYAIDKVSVQNAIGGPIRGDIASTVLPPNIVGYTKFDNYPTTNNSGDATKAKASLTACGQPNGFSIGLSARADRPNEIAAATSIQGSLAKVGIKATIQQYPSGKYFSDYAGAPAFVHQHKLGLMMMAWAADWPTGYGFLDQVVAGDTIKASGNTNLSELNDPTINKMVSDAIANTDTAARTAAWGQIDKAVMDQAVIVPLVYRKDLLYRPTSATNVFVTQAYGMYDYLTIGTK
jgi:ABC-type transport system substrate-binding protein